MSEMKKKQGPPIKYRETYPRMAKVACEEGGFTDIGLARLFGVCKATVNAWKRRYPEFKAAIKEGKDTFDVEVVEAALLKRALGFSYNEIVKELDLDQDKLVTKKQIRKHVAPDVKAQVFWLRNRARGRWPDTQKFDSNVNVGLTHEEMLDQLEVSPSGNSE